MVADTSSRGSRLFPEIHVHFGVSQIALSPRAQIAAASATLVIAVALYYLGYSRIGEERGIASREAAVVRAQTANADLQDEVANLRDKLALASRARDQADAQSSALAGQAGSLRALLSAAEAKLRSLDGRRSLATLPRPEFQQLSVTEEAGPGSGRIGQLTQALEQNQRELHLVEAQRATLAARPSKVEADRADPPARGQYKTRLEAAARQLQQISADRDKALTERDRLRARIAQLELKHSRRDFLGPRDSVGGFQVAGLITTELVQAEADPPSAEPLLPGPPRLETVITDAPPEAQQDTHSVADIGWRAVAEFRRALASTGLNIDRLFPQFGLGRAEGGPFVPPPKGDRPDAISPDRLEAMRSLLKSLPLSVPLERCQLESRFGPRRDPFNRRLSFHTGIDLSAPYMSPVYATAGGTVTFAGYRSEYGKVVEIDHGNGIATLYGHLHRSVVSVGQRIAEHTQIGFLGSTGRSSGPHVHYEILVNDEPQDPEKFIGLARLIPVAKQQ